MAAWGIVCAPDLPDATVVVAERIASLKAQKAHHGTVLMVSRRDPSAPQSYFLNLFTGLKTHPRSTITCGTSGSGCAALSELGARRMIRRVHELRPSTMFDRPARSGSRPGRCNVLRSCRRNCQHALIRSKLISRLCSQPSILRKTQGTDFLAEGCVYWGSEKYARIQCSAEASWRLAARRHDPHRRQVR